VFNLKKITKTIISIVSIIAFFMTFNILSYELKKVCKSFLKIDNNENDNQNKEHYNLIVYSSNMSTCTASEQEIANINSSVTYGSVLAKDKANNADGVKSNLVVAYLVHMSVDWISNSDLAMKHPHIATLNFWIHAIIFRTVPCVILLVLSILLIHLMYTASLNKMKLISQGKPRDFEKDKEFNRTTTMLLIIVISFMIMEFPHGILYIICGMSEQFFVEVYSYLADLLDILVLINSSIIFSLYCLMSSQFRNKFKDIFINK
jgi:hypothetical protein